MNILVINQPLNNRGDEAAHRAFLNSLLALLPEANIAVLFIESYSPEGIRQFTVKDDRCVYVNLHPDSRFWQIAEEWIQRGDMSEWKTCTSFSTMKSFYDVADVIVCAPGGICMGAFQDWWHIFYLKYAQFLGKPLAYFGRSFGPFPELTERHRRFKQESQSLLKYFSFISIRDKVTEDIAAQMGIPFTPMLDSAFMTCPHVPIPQLAKDILGVKPYMVFVPNYLLWHPSYKGKADKSSVIMFYTQLISVIWDTHPDMRIVMLPQTFGNGTYEGDDINFFQDIAAGINDERIIVFPDTYSSDIQQTIIANASFLIGARYHSVVFAINQSVPFIALNYEHKIQGLLRSLDKEDCMVDITDILDTPVAMRNAIEKVERLLPLIKSDSAARESAYLQTIGCMRDFVSFLRGSC